MGKRFVEELKTRIRVKGKFDLRKFGVGRNGQKKA